MPQFVTTPGGTCGGGGGIPPKEQGLCDYYFAKPSDRSPLYGRTATTTATGEDLATATSGSKGRNLLHRASDKKFSTTPAGYGVEAQKATIAGATFLNDCSASSIQRLTNDSDSEVAAVGPLAAGTECDSLFSVHDESIEELYGYYNLGCSSSTNASANNSCVEKSIEGLLSKGCNESDTDQKKIEKESSTSSKKKQKIEEKPPELPPPVIKKKAR